MEKFGDLLLGVWREACRHIDIRESTTAIARMLARHMPIDGVVVREFDLKRSCLETVAVGLVGQRGTSGASRTECLPPEMQRLLAWCRRGEIGHGGGRFSRQREWTRAIPEGVDGDVLTGPLSNRGGALGVLLLLAHPSSRFDSHDQRMLRSLLDPFAVALENSHRIRELAALREAAEADRQSLLTRLGRTHVGDTIIGADAGLRPVMERVELVAKSDVPVLILGETGTGKEVIARAIHIGSPRAAGPFIRANCGAIPADLIDSQLFGHERGSFTGATELRKGWFERADGGTLFLDEIAELSLAAQVRLLRILQDGQLERIGGQSPIKVDVRIVAATHRDLSGRVREGRFREDLWYRVAVFPILLPPLRERKEDIPALGYHFAQRAATRFALPIQVPSPEDVASLVTYPWPGNVREFAAVIDRAALLGNGGGLEVAKALGVSSLSTEGQRPEPQPANSSRPPGLASLDTAMRHHLEAALAATGGRIEGPGGAAASLQINPHTLRARMRKLAIDWARFRSRP